MPTDDVKNAVFDLKLDRIFFLKLRLELLSPKIKMDTLRETNIAMENPPF